ncbi:MAG TPA: indolepyruvate oxidoreductase subunit beta [Polyangia bacterium]|jgi:indolepyruvate ferredoxin oxidoreductase beta subunit
MNPNATTAKTDIVVAGVGGQGILTVAFIVDHAALKHGLHFKQSEVHGMSQRGGAVQSFLRIADQPIHSDLVPFGVADLILAVEPVEALRYLEFLAPGGLVVASMAPFVNIADYPEIESVLDAIAGLPRHVLVDAERLAKSAGSGRAENTVMIGAASPYLPFPPATYHELIATLFGQKKQALVDINIRAFELGALASQAYAEFLARGLTPRQARLLARKLDFSVDPRPGALDWAAAFKSAAGESLMAALESLTRPIAGRPEVARRVAALPALPAPAVAAVTAVLTEGP